MKAGNGIIIRQITPESGMALPLRHPHFLSSVGVILNPPATLTGVPFLTLAKNNIFPLSAK
ncbi:hypothetical protein C7Y69_00485 [Alteromonas sp. KS69]|jgi:hypothetical protein|uniref:hypothetical protein n=1 Tax=Alteromonas sp. KS69 TaxID=2109917 RepID=UPI000C10D913|nr:hypothetical protein [Alteromonas sp. KS69]PHS55208.1 MAG: hypothetical protein COB03_10370 [Alteromonas sp.]RUP83858.1 hypothetical protein C7Y69_00485 [Alteromonas sp. KS69]|tara:strand:- start:5757 stop:5939 length:183 start_codon:yes stop_codon:yes gene_type:complete